MPELSRFFGIVIRMFYSDYEPAHFHAIYGEYEVLIEIETLSVFRGELPRRAIALVSEWAALYRVELREDWRPARNGKRSKRSSLSIEVTPLWPFCGFRGPTAPTFVLIWSGAPPAEGQQSSRPLNDEKTHGAN